jgi:hypothetical protein
VKSTYSIVVAAGIALIIGIVWVKGFLFTEVFHTHKSNELHRAALLQIRDAVSIDASYAEDLAAYWQHRTDSLRLFADRPAEWVITVPMEFGASDWRLVVEFHDGRVSAVRVRTSNGPPPKDGPKDKVKGSR